MNWVETAGGSALHQDGKIVGWVTSTTNEGFLCGLVGQPRTHKHRVSSKAEAKTKLEAMVKHKAWNVSRNERRS